MKTYLVEVFDKKDSYGQGMPVPQFEATCMKEAHEVIMETLGLVVSIGECTS